MWHAAENPRNSLSKVQAMYTLEQKPTQQWIHEQME